MPKPAIAFAALLLLASPGLAKDKDKIDPRIGAAIDCSSVADGQARLQCYDKAIAGLKQALEAGQLISAEDSRKPLALEGTVQAAGSMGFLRFWVIMENGDRWQLIATSTRETAPKRGAKVKLKKGIMGNYWFIDPAANNMKASYMGRSS